MQGLKSSFVRCMVLAGILVAWLPAAQFTNACKAPQFPASKATPIDTLCGTGGTPGGVDSAQNQVKNNFCAAGPAKPVTVQDMVGLQQKVEQDKSINFGNDRDHPLSAKAGPTTNRAPLTAMGEGTQVVLQGFVLIARQEGPESVNCGSSVPDKPVNHDIHIAIVDSASNQTECSGVVVEMSPHHRPTTWTQSAVEAAATGHFPVRVTGQLFFDSSHTPCQNGAPISGDPSRASLWEVHPIYKFEVCTQGNCSSGTGWTPMESWKPPKAGKKN
ncbi:MAG TPA: hypothetical protein VLY04_22170 [Bryobacteraceae bacterium]|nr:hypothetical protein [Bryobacteraceae bacterium]